jgi:hypothetical protein
MSRFSPQDEFIHQDYPRGGEVAWKENWYFNFIDREHNAWGINHISLSRHNQSANFRAFHVVDGEILVPAGEEITPRVLNDVLLREQIETVRVRSVLQCESAVGVCAMCYGCSLASGSGHLVDVGEAIGIVAAQSIGEPGT